MKRTNPSVWLGLAATLALATPAWSQESVPVAAVPPAAPSASSAPADPPGPPPLAGPAPTASPRAEPARLIPAQQVDGEALSPARSPLTSAQIAKKRSSSVTTLIAGGINSAIGVSLLVGSAALLSQNTFCDLGSSHETNAGYTGCSNALFGWNLLGFGASHLLVGSILLIVGGASYAPSP